MVTIESKSVTPFQQNARLLFRGDSACIVDPGGDIDDLLASIDLQKFKVEAVLLTHSHIDHCAGVAPLFRKLDAAGCQKPVLYAGSESDLRRSISLQAQFFGLDPKEYEDCPEPDIYLDSRMKLQLLNLELEARFTPGHSPGHYSFVLPGGDYLIVEESGTQKFNGEVVISGDALFHSSIGRTDFPGSSSERLLASIRLELFTLPDSTLVLPGHGPATTIGREKRYNPFLASEIAE